MSRALITGGAGFIGSHLAEHLADGGDQVTVLDDLSTGSLLNLSRLEGCPNFRFVNGSVVDAGVVTHLIEEADVVYHLAAAVGVEHILRNPLSSLETNIRGTENVLRACAISSRRVLIASTSEVYGKNDKDALSEDDDRVYGSSRLSRWFYACAKSIDEAFALAYWQEQALPVTVVRFFNTVGPRQTGRYGMVVPRLVSQALRNEPLTVFGDGQQTRCFTNVHDVVRSMLALMDCSETAGEVFNIGQADEIRILDLAKRIIELSDSRSKIAVVPYDHPQAFGRQASGYEDMRRRVPNISKLRRYVGFEPQTPLDETLRQVIEYHRRLLFSRPMRNGHAVVVRPDPQREVNHWATPPWAEPRDTAVANSS
jgi:UDP-glucose 4-epimerase